MRLWGPLKPGPRAVGFRVVNARDSSRPLAGAKGGRPIQISLWYPAAAGRDTPMTYGDYVGLAASERTLEPRDPGPGGGNARRVSTLRGRYRGPRKRDLALARVQGGREPRRGSPPPARSLWC